MMRATMDWRVKGVVQKGLASVRVGPWVNDLLQITLGERRDLGRHVHTKVREDWCALLAQMAEIGLDPRDLEYLELARMTIAPEFRRYPPEQLASSSVMVVARKPLASSAR
jgi:hypothetical protein